jgi:hypothetical protein
MRQSTALAGLEKTASACPSLWWRCDHVLVPENVLTRPHLAVGHDVPPADYEASQTRWTS